MANTAPAEVVQRLRRSALASVLQEAASPA
jgi:hypothetical protein